MNLDILKRYTSGELSTKQFLSVHRDAGELLDILYENLGEHEWVTSVQDWPDPKRKNPAAHFLVLKTMMLVTPLIFLLGGIAFLASGPMPALVTVLTLFGIFAGLAITMLISRMRTEHGQEGKTVLVVTNRRLMRVWLDGSGEMQAWWLGEDSSENVSIEAVSPTIKFLLELDLGKVNLN
jgi:hypothetical protein